MKWSYGVTTVPARRDDLLPRTLASLAAGGFPAPRLFVDGARDGFDGFGLDVTYRFPLVRTGANWLMSLLEMYVREPHADRYVLFQDDVLSVANLRQYLEAAPWPGGRAYLNLYTFAGNVSLMIQHGRDGWFKSNQLGKGALGLVFDNAGCRALLQSQHMVDRLNDPQWGWRKVDGGIAEAMKKHGNRFHEREGKEDHPPEAYKVWVPEPFTEFCHRPSLLQHSGTTSVMDKRRWLEDKKTPVTAHDPDHPAYVWPADTQGAGWPGEAFDALRFLPEPVRA